MKFIVMLIIWTGIITGGCFLFLTPDVIVGFVINLTLIFVVSGTIGFCTIYLFERKTMYNRHKVLLLPWIPALIISPIFIHSKLPFRLDPGLLVILVFSSIGGIIAHNRYIKKQFKIV